MTTPNFVETDTAIELDQLADLLESASHYTVQHLDGLTLYRAIDELNRPFVVVACRLSGTAVVIRPDMSHTGAPLRPRRLAANDDAPIAA